MRADHPTGRLQRLARMRGFEVERHEPDPRGWKVVNRDGRTVGEVRDLIIDTERMRATYLDVELDSKVMDFRDDPHVWVPIERAQRDGKRVVVEEIGPAWANELCTAREQHQHDFWDSWWHRGQTRRDASYGTPITRTVTRDDLERVMQDVRPGETVRIPVVNEELVIERRPTAVESLRREDVVMNRADDELPPPERR